MAATLLGGDGGDGGLHALGSQDGAPGGDGGRAERRAETYESGQFEGVVEVSVDN